MAMLSDFSALEAAFAEVPDVSFLEHPEKATMAHIASAVKTVPLSFFMKFSYEK